MLLITGLGNTGKEYENTPHNAGFLFVEMLRERMKGEGRLQVSDWEDEGKLFFSEICKIKKDGELVCILQKPLTYMNRSGLAVRSISEKFKFERFILAHDDLDIELGKYKIQEGKSPNGHNGVISVEGTLGREDFTRVRIGIENRGDRKIPGKDYVLMKYTQDETDSLREAISSSIEEIVTFLPSK